MSEAANQRRIFLASIITLIAAGLGFAVRGGVLKDWGSQFGFTQFELGAITGGGLVGFGVVIVLASLITDRIGYKAILIVAFILHALSAVVTLAATPVYTAWGSAPTYWCLYIGMFMFAVANGLCEAVINPLTATLYPKQKTHYLNILHAGWPAGLVIGGIIGITLVGKVRWEIPMAAFLVPVVLYGVMILPARFPQSEVQRAGVGYGEMFKQFLSPMLLFLLLLHACVGYVELGTDSWITNITTSILESNNQGFLLFIYASTIMFILRFFAGPIVERINPLGLLFASAVIGSTGLLLLGNVQSVALVWVAVTIYGLGKTFLWPTMLGVVGERFPRGGAITMGAVGGIGMLSAGLLGGPGIGYKQDRFASEKLQELSPPTYERYAAGQENAFLFLPKIRGLDGQKVALALDEAARAELGRSVELLKEQGRTIDAITNLHLWWTTTGAPNVEADKEPVAASRIHGGRTALIYTAAVPAFMALGYLLLILYFRAKGGYRQLHVDPTLGGTAVDEGLAEKHGKAG